MEAISVPKGFKVTPEQFEQLASAEQSARMELTKDGELITVSRRAYAQRVLCTRPLRGQGR